MGIRLHRGDRGGTESTQRTTDRGYDTGYMRNYTSPSMSTYSAARTTQASEPPQLTPQQIQIQSAQRDLKKRIGDIITKAQHGAHPAINQDHLLANLWAFSPNGTLDPSVWATASVRVSSAIKQKTPERPDYAETAIGEIHTAIADHNAAVTTINAQNSPESAPKTATSDETAPADAVADERHAEVAPTRADETSMARAPRSTKAPMAVRLQSSPSADFTDRSALTAGIHDAVKKPFDFMVNGVGQAAAELAAINDTVNKQAIAAFMQLAFTALSGHIDFHFKKADALLAKRWEQPTPKRAKKVEKAPDKPAPEAKYTDKTVNSLFTPIKDDMISAFQRSLTGDVHLIDLLEQTQNVLTDLGILRTTQYMDNLARLFPVGHPDAMASLNGLFNALMGVDSRRYKALSYADMVRTALQLKGKAEDQSTLGPGNHRTGSTVIELDSHPTDPRAPLTLRKIMIEGLPAAVARTLGDDSAYQGVPLRQLMPDGKVHLKFADGLTIGAHYSGQAFGQFTYVIPPAAQIFKKQSEPKVPIIARPIETESAYDQSMLGMRYGDEALTQRDAATRLFGEAMMLPCAGAISTPKPFFLTILGK